MEELFSYQNNVLALTPDRWYRSAFADMPWDQRLLGIKGLRGVGKTTMMLQFLKHHYQDTKHGLYVTADNPWFYENSLYDLITQWDKNQGKLLLIDEIHKYPSWARELKVGYDGHPHMQFIFSASSAFDIYQAEADLSRRAVVTLLPGMSFREYLEFAHDVSLPMISFEDILNDGDSISRSICDQVRPLAYFTEYLKLGYFPFSAKGNDELAPQKIAQIINAVLENDLAFVQEFSPANIRKIKQLLGVIAESVPFLPNISKIAERLKIGRNTVYNYLEQLELARILNFIRKPGKGITALQKPDKIYFENTNLTYALYANANIGAIRETFFINQFKNTGHPIHLADPGDFLVNGEWTFEIGGKSKGFSQIKNIEKARVVRDDSEYAYGHVIPLWLFGLMY